MTTKTDKPDNMKRPQGKRVARDVLEITAAGLGGLLWALATFEKGGD